MVQIKMCGIKTVNAARWVQEAGAHFMGCIFWSQSRRYVPPARAKAMVKATPKIFHVGVFVDSPAEEINAIASACSLDYVQLHGHEPASEAEKIHVPVIKAYRWGDDFSAIEANTYPAAMVLLDTYNPRKIGGTGNVFPWEAAKEEVAKLQKPWFLAGGIRVENAKEAVQTLHPFALDVSGGLEEDGEKTQAKIKAFMQMCKQEGL